MTNAWLDVTHNAGIARIVHMSYRSKTHTWNDVILIKRSMIRVFMGVLFSDNFKCNNCIESVTDEWASTNHWWNNTDKGKTNVLREKLSQCHFGPLEIPHRWDLTWGISDNRPMTDWLHHSTNQYCQIYVCLGL